MSQLEYAMLHGWSATCGHDLDHGLVFKVAKNPLIGPPPATHSSIFFLSTFENAGCSYGVLKANVIDRIRSFHVPVAFSEKKHGTMSGLLYKNVKNIM